MKVQASEELLVETLRVVRHVAERLAVSPDEVYGRGKTWRVARARAIVWLYLYDRYGVGTTTLGQLFGRDHSTASKMITNTRALLAGEAGARELYASIPEARRPVVVDRVVTPADLVRLYARLDAALRDADGLRSELAEVLAVVRQGRGAA